MLRYIVQKLRDDPTLLRSIYKQMQTDEVLITTGSIEPDPTAARPEEFWHKTYMCWGRLPKNFYISWLEEKLGMSTSIGRHLSKKGCGLVREVIEFMTDIATKTKLPRCCLQKKVCEKVLWTMYQVFGERGQDGWLEKALGHLPMRIDWFRFGVYRVVISDDLCVRVSHVSGHDLDASVFGGVTTVEYNYSDRTAIARCSRRSVQCFEELRMLQPKAAEIFDEDYLHSIALVAHDENQQIVAIEAGSADTVGVKRLPSGELETPQPPKRQTQTVLSCACFSIPCRCRATGRRFFGARAQYGGTARAEMEGSALASAGGCVHLTGESLEAICDGSADRSAQTT